MTTQQQELWLRAAVDALEDIRADEVKAISAEVRRTVTHPSKIVPEIAKLVAERRERIGAEASRQASAAHWPERPMVVRQPPLPLTRYELDTLTPQAASLGLKYGFLERVDGQLVEVNL
jgi:hypothetical protein